MGEYVDEPPLILEIEVVVEGIRLNLQHIKSGEKCNLVLNQGKEVMLKDADGKAFMKITNSPSQCIIRNM